MELSELQQKIINAPHNKIIVMSAAASGKTRTMTEKVRQLLRNGVNPKEIAVITFTNMAAGELRQRLGEDYKDGMFIGTIHALANYFLLSSGIKTGKILENEDFDKLFEMVDKHRECIKPIEYLLLDEGQDSDALQFKFLFELINPRSFFVCADVRQCQPKGTKITLYDGTEKNIEDIEVGDKLITYSKNKSFQGGKVHNAKNYQVLETEHHFCNEPLIKITLENGKSSIYSPEHICIVNLTDIQENYLVYLMCDENNRFRVGKSQFTCNNNNNVYRAKMLSEGCKKIWILKTFKTDKEARVYEDKISYKYQIPQNTFQLNKTSYTKEDIDFIYEGLDTYQSAKKCLENHGRKIEYPFCFVGDNNHYASNAYNQCYACNILPNNMNALCFNPEDKYRHRREPSKIIKVEYIEPQEVYSLEVEGNHNYVADGILTHNCIYGFRGARPDLLAQLGQKKDVVTYDMNENYRNGANILNYAKKLISPTGVYDTSISMSPYNGTVTECVYNESVITGKIQGARNYGDWAILTRTNYEISAISNTLMKVGIPFDTFKQGDLTKEELNDRMDKNTVKILTVHSAKGLEWDNVMVVGMRYYNLEERRICYVAATRARKNLYWLKSGGRRR